VEISGMAEKEFAVGLLHVSLLLLLFQPSYNTRAKSGKEKQDRVNYRNPRLVWEAERKIGGSNVLSLDHAP